MLKFSLKEYFEIEEEHQGKITRICACNILSLSLQIFRKRMQNRLFRSFNIFLNVPPKRIRIVLNFNNIMWVAITDVLDLSVFIDRVR